MVTENKTQIQYLYYSINRNSKRIGALEDRLSTALEGVFQLTEASAKKVKKLETYLTKFHSSINTIKKEMERCKEELRVLKYYIHKKSSKKSVDDLIAFVESITRSQYVTRDDIRKIVYEYISGAKAKFSNPQHQ